MTPNLKAARSMMLLSAAARLLATMLMMLKMQIAKISLMLPSKLARVMETQSQEHAVASSFQRVAPHNSEEPWHIAVQGAAINAADTAGPSIKIRLYWQDYLME